MKSRFTFFAGYTLFWLLFFFIAKIIFLLYHFNLTSEFPFKDILGIIRHGFPLDLSVAGYLILVPLVLLISTSFSQGKWIAGFMNIYTLLTLIVIIILTLADLEIYKYWGTRLDNTALRFINTPRELLASSTWLAITLISLGLLLLILIFYLPYRKYLSKLLIQADRPRWKGLVIFTLLLPVVILAIRGGTGVATINLSRVYFHPEPFPNHAAINVVWSVGHAWLEKKDQPNPYQYMDNKTVEHYLKNLLSDGVDSVKLLKTSRPNIILIILESFSAKLVEPMGGLPDVTPNFNRLINEGILFSNMYANDSRTDKSIVSILSGYPALSSISIIKFPEKTQNLGIISREMIQNCYHTAFYYGGDIDFANMRSYFVNGHFQRIVTIADFTKTDEKGRWGMPDHVTFKRLFEDCDSSRASFFKVLMTLSNHEPFDIPMDPKFGSKTVDQKVSSSAFYTDSCIGDFINKARKTEWWNNTLIIMLADHGTRFPGNTILYNPRKYRIPMLWLGGAIKSDTIISEYCSQSDLVKTLLNQLEIDPSAYPLSNDILTARYNFAFYEYGDGFGMISDSGRYVFDNDLLKIIERTGTVSDYFIQAGKALQQEVYNVYLRN